VTDACRNTYNVNMFCRYKWFHNGVELNLLVENIRPAGDGSGSIVIEPATVLDEGWYQCRAETQYGTALSNTSLLQKAVLHVDGPTVRNRTVTAGEPFYIPVAALKCFPPASFSWVTAKVMDDEAEMTSSHAVTTGSRIQISENGK